MLVHITDTEKNRTFTADTCRSPKMAGREQDLVGYAALYFGIFRTKKTDPVSLAAYEECVQVLSTSEVDNRPRIVCLPPYQFTRQERLLLARMDAPETLTPAERLTTTTAPTVECPRCHIEYGVTAQEFDSDEIVPCPCCDSGLPKPRTMKGNTTQ